MGKIIEFFEKRGKRKKEGRLKQEKLEKENRERIISDNQATFDDFSQIRKEYLTERHGYEEYFDEEGKHLEQPIKKYHVSHYDNHDWFPTIQFSEDDLVVKLKSGFVGDIAFFTKHGYKIQGKHTDQRWRYGTNMAWSEQTDYIIMIKSESKDQD